MAYQEDVTFNASSSLYQCPEGGIFTRENLGLKVSHLYRGQNPRDIQFNMERTRGIAFREIQRRFNNRIREYDLTFDELKASDEPRLEIHPVKCGDSMSEDALCGKFSVFPLTFSCNKCSDFITISPRELRTFNPDRCQTGNCSGSYDQISVVKFCDQCGLIDQLYYQCKNNPNHRVQLYRPVSDEPGTWRFRCSECGNTLDFLRFQCSHSPRVGASPVTTRAPSKFEPITVQEGGVFTPQVLSVLQVPSLKLPEGIQLPPDDESYLLLALLFDCFDALFEEKGLGIPSIESLSELIAFYGNKTAKNMFIKDNGLQNLTSAEQQERWKIKTNWKEIEIVLNDLRKKYPLDKANAILDYASLTDSLGKGGNSSDLEDMLRRSSDPDVQHRVEKWKNIKKQHGLSTASYVSRITISNVLIGHINGFAKPWEESYIPHFEPLWDDPRSRDKPKAYMYSYETEGLVFELDDEKLVEWLKRSGISIPEEGTSREMIANLESNDVAFDMVETLLHTISHTLISTSEIYTGLSRDSLSEMIFPSAAAIFIYSTNQVNVGSFKYVFEHNMLEWLQQVEDEVMDCTFDPACMESRGACFSCLYLPEFVCYRFNSLLDRGILKGGARYVEGFWQRS